MLLFFNIVAQYAPMDTLSHEIATPTTDSAMSSLPWWIRPSQAVSQHNLLWVAWVQVLFTAVGKVTNTEYW